MRGGHDETTPLVYTIEFEINLLDFDSQYPKDPKTLGERIRKARMDRHMMAKELAQRISVVPETVTNWEKRNLRPTRRHLERLQAVLGLDGEATTPDRGWRRWAGQPASDQSRYFSESASMRTNSCSKRLARNPTST